MTENTKVWLHGLGAAFIGASSTSLSTILVAPDRFNMTTISGAWHLLVVALVSGAVAAAGYLSKSPLPALAPVLGPGDTATIKNPQIATDGTVTGTSATLTKGQ